MLRSAIKLHKIGVKFISTNSSKKASEVIRISKRNDYYKNLGDSGEKNDLKPPGWDEALPYESIPGPKPLPLIGNIWRFMPYIGEFWNMPLKDIYQTLKNKYGNIVMIKGIPGRNPMALLFNVNDMETALRNEGAFPLRTILAESASYYRLVVRKDVFGEVGGVTSVTTLKYIEESLNRSIVENIPDDQLSVTQRLAKIDKRIAVVMGMDMLVARHGKTLATLLYFLAKNPDKQQCLREEVLKNLPEKNSPVTKEVLNKSPYLKAAIKESNRIAPIAIGNLRTTIKDLVLAGYKVPKGTDINTMHLLSSNSNEIFKDPDKFIPERWLRATEDQYSSKNVHPFAYMPFGFGPRSCIGKRLANLELEVALTKIIRNFELSWPHEDMKFSGNFLYGITKPQSQSKGALI